MINMSKYMTYKKGKLRIEITAIKPDSFVNVLWRNNIKVSNIKKENICTYTMDIYSESFNDVNKIAQEYGVQIRVLQKYGLSFVKGKYKNRKAFAFGMVFFIIIIYYLASFIWSISIDTEYNISPYEVRKTLYTWGIKPGINKRSISVFDIEDKLLRENDEIVWVKARIEGTKLHIQISERQIPPNLLKDDTPCNLVASKDGEIIRVYTKAGTAVVSEGDMVRKGELLVKGEQGNEESKYAVHAEGEVIAKTYYERKRIIKLNQVERKRTGKKLEKKYLKIFGKKIFIKNQLNNFKNYDIIVDNNTFLKKEIYYEVKEEKKVIKNIDEVIDDAVDELSAEIVLNFNKSINVIDKIKDVKLNDDVYEVRLVIVAEENIVVPENVTQGIGKEE